MKITTTISRILTLIWITCMYSTSAGAIDESSAIDPTLVDRLIAPEPRIIDLIDQGFHLPVDLGLAIPTELNLTLQAENAVLRKGRALDRHPGFTGSGYVALKGEGSVAWTFDVQKSGLYKLRFRYSLKNGIRPLDIAVKHNDPGDISSLAVEPVSEDNLIQDNISFPKTGDYSNWEIVSFVARFEAGDNTVTLSATGSGAPLIDRLVFSRARFLIEQGDVTPRPTEPEFGEAGYEDTYYGKVDPSGNRTTLEDWKQENDFLDFPHSVVSAQYINAHDLGFGRKMFCLDNGRASCYVENFLDPKGESPETPPGGLFAATVTMERMNFSGRLITAFFVYDKDNNRVNELALDSEGPKSVPESCYACHMGYTSAGGNPVGGQYLPWDIDLLENWPGKQSVAAQKEELRKLNRIIWADASKQYTRPIFTDPVDPATFVGQEQRDRKPSVKALIEGWYDGPPFFDTSFAGNRLPKDTWYDEDVRTDACAIVSTPSGFELADEEKCNRFTHQRFLYKNVYAKACRSCHVAQDETQNVNPGFDGLDWQTAREFETQAYNIVCQPESDDPVMPHAELTFNRFKDDLISTTDGEVASAKDRLCAQPPLPLPDPLDGAALYEANCTSCHGQLSESTKKGESAATIQSAIDVEVPSMDLENLRNLTPAQISAIADALNIP